MVSDTRPVETISERKKKLRSELGIVRKANDTNCDHNISETTINLVGTTYIPSVYFHDSHQHQKNEASPQAA